VTVAENCCVAPEATVELVGEIVTTVGTGAAVTVTTALGDMVPS
jgi:hypothetical protein